MVIQFKDIRMYNFCSYHDATVVLNDKGFCLVSGRNLCKKDSAISNGSGKSTILSAICFALTGETIQGLKTNLKNRDIDENESYVTISFSVDNDDYVITRYIAPKSDMKISKNGADISGKGIRESEKVLSENLPDLTKDLISSTIIIGQGMPSKLSSFSPSGRKDLLEKLTKSDFMIEDIKTRLSNRTAVLNTKLREYEDSLLVNKTQLDLADSEKTKTEISLNDMKKRDFATLIPEHEKTCASIEKDLTETNSNIKVLEDEIEKSNNKIIKLTAEKAKVNDEEFKNYTAKYNLYNTEKTTKQTNIDFLNKEIIKLKSVKDVCPTCGQKIPGVLKPDTAEQEKKIVDLTADIAELDIKLSAVSEQHKQYLLEIDEMYKEIDTLQEILKDKKIELQKQKDSQADFTQYLAEEKERLNELKYDKENDDKIRAALKQKIADAEAAIKTLSNNINIMDVAKLNVEEHLAVVKKIDTLVKRDFRGYLLYNIIEYLDAKAKEYSQIVFNTDELNIYLDGNALDISYCGKIYESLSGGEKQRVDLITQFAIRDLLQTYFNYSSNILALDEITDNLDRVATSRIFDLITTKLKDVESVFIISHHDGELEIPVDSEIQITKDENSISSIKEN